MKKLTITSILALCMACPAMANIDKDASTATCDNATIGTTTGPANLQADWTANTIHLDWYSNDTKQTSTTCTYDGGITLPSTPEVPTGYTFGGWKVRAAAPTLNLSSIIGTGRGANYAYVNGSGSFSQSSDSSVVGSVDHDQAFYGITANNTWAAYYGDNGMVTGQARCSSESGTGLWNGASSASDITTHTTAELGAEDGKYCYCNVTGYTPAGGTLQSLSSPWVFRIGFAAAQGCANSCADDCARSMWYDDTRSLVYRATLLGSVQ